MKALLLNSDFQIIHFVHWKKAIKLFFRNKVDIISTWPNISFNYFGQIMNFPAILKMKYYINKKYVKICFSRKAIFKRDKYTCQYCFKALKSGKATVDHILPKCKGGESTFTNCVAACFVCNSKKGKRTLAEADMKLLTMPIVPAGWTYYISEADGWHKDWDQFLNIKI